MNETIKITEKIWIYSKGLKKKQNKKNWVKTHNTEFNTVKY